MPAPGAADRLPIAVALRQWGPTGDVFVYQQFSRGLNGTPTQPADIETGGHLDVFSCDAAPAGGHFCQTASAVDSDFVGPTTTDPLAESHGLFPSLAIRREGNDFVVPMTRAEHGVVVDCPLDADSKPQWDLMSYDYRTANGTVTGRPLHVAQGLMFCRDHGLTEIHHADGQVPHACYTRPSDQPDDHRVQCNHDDGLNPLQWGNPDNLPVLPVHYERHPSMHVAPNGDRLVITNERRDSDDASRIRLHWPDGAVTKLETYTDKSLEIDFPYLAVSDGIVRVLYQNDTGADSHIAYKWCDTDAHDCTVYDGDGATTDGWEDETAADDGSYPDISYVKHVIDKGLQREFVAFQYNDGTALTTAYRVVVGSRCMATDPLLTETWLFQEVKAPDAGFADQNFAFGRPGLVLDKAHDLVHIVYTEGADWLSRKPRNYNDGTAYWSRAFYGDLPSCTGAP